MICAPYANGLNLRCVLVRGLSLVLGVCVSSVLYAQSGYELAFTPYLPVRTLMQNYQPMRTYLEQRLREPVTLVTASDYKSFNRAVRRRAYDFIVTPANSAYIAHAEFGYIPLLRPVNATRPSVVVPIGSAINSLKDLRGAVITLPDPLAMVSMQALPMLRAAGLDPEADLTLRHMPNHSAAVNFVLSGEAAAAIISDRLLAQMPDVTRNALRIVQTWDAGAAPGIIFLASPSVEMDRAEKIRNAILEFVRDTERGREMMYKMGYAGLVIVKEEELSSIAPYGALLKKALEANP